MDLELDGLVREVMWDNSRVVAYNKVRCFTIFRIKGSFSILFNNN